MAVGHYAISVHVADIRDSGLYLLSQRCENKFC